MKGNFWSGLYSGSLTTSSCSNSLQKNPNALLIKAGAAEQACITFAN